jgi:XTP/dITP diphosphohydrolase
MGDLVIATFNRKKAGEMIEILQELLPGVALHTLQEFPKAEEPEETGTTYRENAIIKALAGCEVTGLPCIADDAGLEIDALDGAPGVYSKRFGGEDMPFPEKNAKILDLLSSVPYTGRGARYRCFIAYARPGKEAITFEATCEGQIARAPSGGGGFGYDPIFYLPERRCTMADLTAAQKHEISHRGKVLRAFSEYIRSSSDPRIRLPSQ